MKLRVKMYCYPDFNYFHIETNRSKCKFKNQNSPQKKLILSEYYVVIIKMIDT